MQLPICALFAWATIVLFSLIPKRMSVLDFVFLYCISYIMTTATFTTFDLNLQLVTISRNPTISFAASIVRIVMIPLLVLLAVDGLQSSKGEKLQWLRAILIWLGLTVFDWVLNLIHVITYQKPFIWHLPRTFLMYFGFILVAWVLSKWYRRFGQQKARRT